MNPSTNPTVTPNLIVTAAGLILALFIALGTPISDEVKTILISLIALAAPFLASWISRNRVIAANNPVDPVDGMPLVRKDSGQPTRAAAARQQKEEAKTMKRRLER